MQQHLTQLFKEFAQFLGAKIDFQTKEIIATIRNNNLNPQKVELDLTSKAIEKLQDSSQIDIQAILKSMKEVSTANTSDMKGLSSEVAKLVKAVESESSETYLLKTQGNLMRQILNVAERMQKKMDSSSDKEEMARLDSIIAAIKANKMEMPKIDVSELKVISAELKTLNRTSRDNKNKTLESKIDRLAVAMEAFVKDFKVDIPKTFKLDDMQVRKISAGSGGAGVQTRGATKKTIANVTLTDTATEYSYTFPPNTVSFTMKIRGQAALLYYAFETGKLPSGDGLAYATLGQNFLQLQDNVEWSNQTIYLGSDVASQVAEIISYQM